MDCKEMNIWKPKKHKYHRLFNYFSVCFSGETPPYHYGTHYSSAMIVASYLYKNDNIEKWPVKR
jgi:hypothetical protein